MGAGWCPPGILGVGIGGTPEKAMLLAKESLMEPLDMHELKANGPSDHLQELRLELFDKVNALGIGAQGLGGLTTVLDVKVKDYPTHAANKPVAVIPNCSATRHVHFTLDGSGPAEFAVPDLNEWPDIKFELGDEVKRVNLDTLTQDELRSWQSGDTLLLSGKMLTGRDAAQEAGGHVRQRRRTAGGFHQSGDLLRWTRRPCQRRSRRTGGARDSNAHG